MTTVRHILFPYDFSVRARQIIPFVRAIVHRTCARLALFIVVPRSFAPLSMPVGQIVRMVVEEAVRERADLLILGRGSVAEPFGRLRTHAFGIIQRSPCPVISV